MIEKILCEPVAERLAWWFARKLAPCFADNDCCNRRHLPKRVPISFAKRTAACKQDRFSGVGFVFLRRSFFEKQYDRLMVF
jgi:hypothetical protein